MRLWRNYLEIIKEKVAYHGIMKWFGLEGTSENILFQPHCYGQGHLPPDKVGQSPIQPCLIYFLSLSFPLLVGANIPFFSSKSLYVLSLLSVDVEDEATTGEVSRNLNLSALHMLQEASKAIDISLAKVRLWWNIEMEVWNGHFCSVRAAMDCSVLCVCLCFNSCCAYSCTSSLFGIHI